MGLPCCKGLFWYHFLYSTHNGSKTGSLNKIKADMGGIRKSLFYDLYVLGCVMDRWGDAFVSVRRSVNFFRCPFQLRFRSKRLCLFLLGSLSQSQVFMKACLRGREAFTSLPDLCYWSSFSLTFHFFSSCNLVEISLGNGLIKRVQKPLKKALCKIKCH